MSDEIYIFRSPLQLERESLALPVPPARPAIVPSPMLDLNEDSLDGPLSVGSADSGAAAVGGMGGGMPISGGGAAGSPGFTKKKPEPRKKLVTAYILFSADVRRITMEENPGVKFGEISRIVAERWRAMSEGDKVRQGQAKSETGKVRHSQDNLVGRQGKADR